MRPHRTTQKHRTQIFQSIWLVYGLLPKPDSLIYLDTKFITSVNWELIVNSVEIIYCEIHSVLIDWCLFMYWNFGLRINLCWLLFQIPNTLVLNNEIITMNILIISSLLDIKLNCALIHYYGWPISQMIHMIQLKVVTIIIEHLSIVLYKNNRLWLSIYLKWIISWKLSYSINMFIHVSVFASDRKLLCECESI